MTRGSLPKGHNSDNKEDKFSIRLCIGLIFIAGILLGLGSVFTPIGFDEGGFPEDKQQNRLMLLYFGIPFLVIGAPMMILSIKKYRTLELTTPTGFTKLYYSGRATKQCTICQKHPTSKKYHLKNVHNLKNVNVNDYFRDCGCDKCADYNKSGE